MPKSQPKTFAVIGNPVEQSLSPRMHNAAFRDLGIDAEYIKIKVEQNELANIINKLKSGELSGFNVTIPFKEEIVNFLDIASPAVQKIGACNTVYLKNNKIHGDNTDGQGYINSLTLDMEFNPQNKNILVLGCGGAAKAICHALSEHQPKSLTLANRSQNRANELSAAITKFNPTFKVTTCPFPNLEIELLTKIDLVINATSLGLKNNPWPNLDFLKHLPQHALISDIIYNPRETQLLQEASRLNLNIHYGAGMLIHQGALAFELWTELHAPIDVMTEALMTSNLH